MRVLGLAFVALAGPALAELRHEVLEIGPEVVWIEVVDGAEAMWVGLDGQDRVQVLTGPDLEILLQATESEAASMLGARALVVATPASHSCEDFSVALAYYILPLETLAAEGPMTSCGALELSVAPGAIVLETRGEGPGRAWMPGRGYQDRAE